MRASILLVALVLAAPVVGEAAEPARTAAPSREHLKRAAELLQIVHVDRSTAEALDIALRLQLQQQPKLEPYEDALRAFMQKYMSWESLKDDYTRIYAEAFSEQELRQMIAFYRTSTGQKAVSMIPELMSKGAAIGQSRIQENRDELQQMIEKRQKEIESHHPVP